MRRIDVLTGDGRLMQPGGDSMDACVEYDADGRAVRLLDGGKVVAVSQYGPGRDVVSVSYPSGSGAAGNGEPAEQAAVATVMRQRRLRVAGTGGAMYRELHVLHRDSEVDAGYVAFVTIADGQARYQRVVASPRKGVGEVVLDFDEGGRLLGIEFIGAATIPLDFRAPLVKVDQGDLEALPIAGDCS